MKYGTRELNGASCKVLKPVSLPQKMHNDIREITSVYVPMELRGQGLATKLLDKVCTEADKFKMILVLTVDPYEDGEMTQEQLAKWYEDKFGFLPIQQEPLMMARMFAIYIKKSHNIANAIAEGYPT